MDQYPSNTTPLQTDSEAMSLHKILKLLDDRISAGAALEAAGTLLPTAGTFTSITYSPAAQPTTIVFKNGASVVATLTVTYDGGAVSSIVKS